MKEVKKKKKEREAEILSIVNDLKKHLWLWKKVHEKK